MNVNEQRRSVSVLVAAVGLAVLVVSGCMVGPNYQSAAADSPHCVGRRGGDADWPTVRGHRTASRPHAVVAAVQ